MKKNGFHTIKHRILVIVAIISIILSFYMTWRERDCVILINQILPTLLFFIGLKYPTMINATVFAGVAFWSACSDFFVLFMSFSRGSLYVAELSDCSLYLTLGVIFSWMYAFESVDWVKELCRVRKHSYKADDIDKIEKGLITFLCPHYGLSIIICVIIAGLGWVIIPLGSVFGIDVIIEVIIVSLACILASILIDADTVKNYDLYVRDLSDSRVPLCQAALDYSGGNEYCNDSIVLGQKYIFVKGSSILYEYNSICSISHRWHIEGKIIITGDCMR